MKIKHKNIFKSLLALTLAFIMLLGAAPLSALVGIDFASLFAPKAEAAEAACKVGDIIEFGSYPQSRVTDSATVSTLDKISKNWVSYGYYSGDESYGYRYDSMVRGDWMRYADITYNGAKYRAVFLRSTDHMIHSVHPHLTAHIKMITAIRLTIHIISSMSRSSGACSIPQRVLSFVKIQSTPRLTAIHYILMDMTFTEVTTLKTHTMPAITPRVA